MIAVEQVPAGQEGDAIVIFHTAVEQAGIGERFQLLGDTRLDHRQYRGDNQVIARQVGLRRDDIRGDMQAVQGAEIFLALRDIL